MYLQILVTVTTVPTQQPSTDPTVNPTRDTFVDLTQPWPTSTETGILFLEFTI